MTAWADAVALAERELALVRAGEWDLVAEVSDERTRLTASLPQATEALRPLLERLAALEAALVETLQAARETTVRELGSLRRGRETVGDLDVLITGPCCVNDDHRAGLIEEILRFPGIHEVLAKGDNKVSTDLGVVKASKWENAVEVAVPTAETDINAAYEDAIHVLPTKPLKEEKTVDEATVQEDFYRNFRTKRAAFLPSFVQ